MKRKIAGLVFVLFVSLSGIASGNSPVNVKTSKEFRDALESGISDIRITASISGNFTIPRGVSSISGAGQNITVTPSDLSKPVFDVESPSFLQNSDGLKISGITIISPGMRGAVDANTSSRPLTLTGVRIVGYRGNRKSAVGCKPSIATHISGCTFENLNAGIYAANPGSAYDITVDSCIFRGVSQALTMEKTNPNARASITRCKGDKVGWWVSQHATGNLMMNVAVDQATIDSCSESDYYHVGIDKMENFSSKKLQDYKNDLESKFLAIPAETRKLIVREAHRGLDGIRIYASTGLARKMKEADFSPEGRQVIDECLNLYALLASAPVAGVFRDDGTIDDSRLFALYEGAVSSMVSDKNLAGPMVYSFMSKSDLAPFTRMAGRISWGKSGNVDEALSRINQNPDRIFRDNLHKYKDWMTELDEMRNEFDNIARSAKSNTDTSYFAILENRLRSIRNLGRAASMMTRAAFFDLPVGVSFVVNYVRVSQESDKAKIISICRELGSFYGISQQLCVLARTQTMRNVLINFWKDSLTEFVFLSSFGKDTSKYDALLTLLRVDHDIMRDADNVSKFFKEWQ